MTARPSRRQLLIGAAAGAAGLGVGGVLGATVGSDSDAPSGTARRSGEAPAAGDAPAAGGDAAAGVGVVDPHGIHQAGIASPVQPWVSVVALDLHARTDRGGIGRLLRAWTDDIRALTSGAPTTADTAPELAGDPAGLTVTVGVGPAAVRRAGAPGGWPDVEALPVMTHDVLQEHRCAGDLLLTIGAGNALTVWHAVRRLVADAAPFARLRWMQRGFWRHGRPGAPDAVGRNLMGQVDGTANPPPGSPLFERTVWVRDDPPWLVGGTMAVVRRIRMNLDTWDLLPRSRQEAVIGRTLTDGAPLGGGVGDPLPLTARGTGGALVIAPDAHARLAHPSSNGGARIYRRGVNYDDGLDAAGRPDVGLLFISYQASVTRQLLPILTRLDRADALNVWTTTTASSVFAILPGFGPDGWLGQRLAG